MSDRYDLIVLELPVVASLISRVAREALDEIILVGALARLLEYDSSLDDETAVVVPCPTLWLMDSLFTGFSEGVAAGLFLRNLEKRFESAELMFVFYDVSAIFTLIDAAAILLSSNHGILIYFSLRRCCNLWHLLVTGSSVFSLVGVVCFFLFAVQGVPTLPLKVL